MLLFRSISTLSLLTYCAIALGNGVYSSVGATDSTKHKRKKVVNKTTYSTKKLKSESFDKRFIAAPLDILRGKVAGVNIAHSGAERLAMLNSVRVRGTTSVTAGNDPLVIIDGVSSDLSSLSTIYPADIASFTILKNASETAIYGSRGASGVILVTTKKGAAGKFKISYDTNIGVEHTTSEIQVLNGSQYISTAKALNQFAIDGGYNTNFQKEITRVGFIQNHHLAFSGGVDESNYRASVSYSGHEMVVKNNNY
ncbi:MAG: TonB-dependent receptor plug domain-containing protein, partial [Prevotella nanceiensis]|nr:TonB-dependent receptor plug domain-containing protein [Hoylesella nanceiensis]